MSEPGRKELPAKVCQALSQVLGGISAQLHEPEFTGNEWQYLKDSLDSTFVSSVGKYVDQFEQNLAEYTGAARAVAVVNGTAALHVALKLAGVEKNTEVLVPALTFVATANAVSYCYAEPHFVDCEEGTLGVDAGKLYDYLAKITTRQNGECVNKHTGRKISAMVVMHTFGHPSNMEGLLQVSRDFHVPLVEDAAEALGSYYAGQHVGFFGTAGALSFNGNKTITTGGGGAILFNDEKLARKAKHLTTTAKLSHPWEYRHDAVGFNYRMPNLNAALGCAQLECLEDKLLGKRRLFDRYKNAFKDISGIKILVEPDKCKSNYWLQTLVLDKEAAGMKDEILQVTNESGFATRPAWELLSRLPPYEHSACMSLETASSLYDRLVNIPSSSFL